MFEQCLARTFLGERRRVGQDVFHRAERGDELTCRLVADAGDAGHVVGRVADERQVVGDEARLHAQSLGCVLDAHPLLFDRCRAATAGVEQPDARSDQLLEILVPRHDDHVHARVASLGRQRADDVVGFVALERQNRNVVRLQQLTDALHPAIEVRLQLLGEFFARGLVGGIALVSERQTGVVHPTEVLGLVLLEQSVEKVDDAPGSGRVLATTGGERPRDQREERAVDERVAIDEEKPRWGRRVSHHGKLRAGLGTRHSAGVPRAESRAMKRQPPAIAGRRRQPNGRRIRVGRQTRTTFAA